MEGGEYRGKCLCGSVELKVTANTNKFIVCHCNICKKWNGGPQFALPCGTHVEITGKDNVSEFNSSPWATRGFCKHCGTHLYYKLNDTGEHNVLLGVLDIDKDEKLELAMQYFIDLKPSYYRLDSASPVMTEAEVLEKFSA
ncbi:aldehyde-activating protein [Vibrio sp. HA2012]|uniref:GFA family protein n=1 Tax=Vibrio sp. HA2012 TaxID=1971595 RepID=UPI000C2BDDC5|nr:GFA family protein [Vibrio sp. HA2012]PJC86528.1 aldehyde-activating protein [Vibrio sp. HA2012]